MKINKLILSTFIIIGSFNYSLANEDKPNITPAPRIKVDEVVLFSNPDYEKKPLFKVEYVKNKTYLPKPRIKPKNNLNDLVNIHISVNKNVNVKSNKFIVPDFWGF